MESVSYCSPLLYPLGRSWKAISYKLILESEASLKEITASFLQIMEENYYFFKNLKLLSFRQIRLVPKKKKQTEEKAKVVAAVWGMEFIKFHAALQI